MLRRLVREIFCCRGRGARLAATDFQRASGWWWGRWGWPPPPERGPAGTGGAHRAAPPAWQGSTWQAGQQVIHSCPPLKVFCILCEWNRINGNQKTVASGHGSHPTAPFGHFVGHTPGHSDATKRWKKWYRKIKKWWKVVKSIANNGSVMRSYGPTPFPVHS